MFYQSLPLRNSCSFLPLALLPNPNLLLLQTLSLALEKSVTAYALAYQPPLPSPGHHQLPPPTPASRNSQKTPENTHSKPRSSRHSEKNSEIQSEKIVSLGTINESKAVLETESPDSQVENRLIDEAKIPHFQLCSHDLQIKRASLMERRVDAWKIERQRKKSTKITYNWC